MLMLIMLTACNFMRYKTILIDNLHDCCGGRGFNCKKSSDSFLGNCCSLYNATSSLLKGGIRSMN